MSPTDSNSSNTSNHIVENLEKLAVDAALKCNWQEALDYNLQICELEPENITCLNRIAKAYIELGEYNKAKSHYEKVLELDQYNNIAQKNIKKIATYKQNKQGNGQLAHTPAPLYFASSFIAEPGITKSVGLNKVAEPQKLLAVTPGSMINLTPKNRGITVTDSNNQYIGVLPDDTAFHLMRFINAGYKYSAFIQSVKPNAVMILIREVSRSKKLRDQATFLDDTKVLTYSTDHFSFLQDDSAQDDTDGSSEETLV